MKHLILSLFILVCGASAFAATPEELKAETPAGLSSDVGGLTEANIESALMAREIKGAEAASAVTALKVSGAKESDIPVRLESKKGEAGEGSPLTKMLMGLAVVGGLAMAGWLALKKYKFANKTVNPHTQMKILAQHHLGPKKSLAIVRVAGESVLIGITDHNISLIKALSLLDEDVPEETPQNFGQVMAKNTRTQTAKFDSEAEADEFSISGIKDVVSSRLKNMRSIE
ncbi:MAG: FliO/MopB family protein [Bdellovibrio sp.]|jgi:flagellar protein FliO/FliZ